MIVCSCNRLTDRDIAGCCTGGPDAPRMVGQVYRCLGCSPRCGRCVRTIDALMKAANAAAGAACACPAACQCAARPHAHGHEHVHEHAHAA